MFRKTKYVCGEVKTMMGSLPGAIILPNYINHDTVKELFEEITGAGFFCVHSVNNNLEIEVFGKSETLNISSQPDDIHYIKNALDIR